MKKLRSLLLIGAVLTMAAVTHAQTPSPIVPPVGSITNGLSFTNTTLEVYTAAGYESGTTTAVQARTGFSYTLFNGFGPSIEIANETTGNAIAEMDAYFEYHKRTGSFEIVGGLGAGYNWDTKRTSAKLALGLNYNLTQVGSTFEYVGTRLEMGYDFSTGSRPTITPLIVAGLSY